MSLLIPGNCASPTFFSVWIEVWRFVLLYFICWIDVPCEIGVKETHARIEQTGNSIFFQKFYFIDAVVVVDNFDNLIARQIFQQEIDKKQFQWSTALYTFLLLSISTYVYLYLSRPVYQSTYHLYLNTYIYLRVYLSTYKPTWYIYLSIYLPTCKSTYLPSLPHCLYIPTFISLYLYIPTCISLYLYLYLPTCIYLNRTRANHDNYSHKITRSIETV